MRRERKQERGGWAQRGAAEYRSVHRAWLV
jgi:hypothetical protein